ncbi:MAG: flippase-like domain-containing protein [Propionibacterium sp.]|nr:flippase-like domain-containing protein [Propionibacterium sp.]
MSEQTEPEDSRHARRVRHGRRIVQMVLVGTVVYLAVPLVSQADKVADALVRADPWWMLASLAFFLCGSVAAALSLRACAGVTMPFRSAVEMQIAANFVGTATPASVGTMALAVRYLNRRGVPLPVAGAVVGLQGAVQFLVHVVLLAALVIFGGRSVDLLHEAPDEHVVVAVTGLVLVFLAVALGVPRLRQALTRVWQEHGREIVSNLTTLVRTPRRLGAAVLGAAGTTLSAAAALWAAILAVSGGSHPVMAAFTTMVGETLATAAPTPGGIGAVEAALVASMTAFGLAPGTALAAAFGYRLTSTWIPVLIGWLLYNRLQRRGEI